MESVLSVTNNQRCVTSQKSENFVFIFVGLISYTLFLVLLFLLHLCFYSLTQVLTVPNMLLRWFMLLGIIVVHFYVSVVASRKPQPTTSRTRVPFFIWQLSRKLRSMTGPANSVASVTNLFTFNTIQPYSQELTTGPNIYRVETSHNRIPIFFRSTLKTSYRLHPHLLTYPFVPDFRLKILCVPHVTHAMCHVYLIYFFSVFLQIYNKNYLARSSFLPTYLSFSFPINVARCLFQYSLQFFNLLRR